MTPFDSSAPVASNATVVVSVPVALAASVRHGSASVGTARVQARRRRAALALSAGALALVGLTGCSAAGTPSASGSASASSSAGAGSSASAAPTDSATPTPTPSAAGTAVGLTCAEVLTPDDVYAFNPNFGTAPGFTPSTEAAKTAVQYQGLACGLLNQTNSDLIEISVTKPNPVLMTQLQDKAVAGSKIVPTYGTPPAVQGYFTSANGTGEAQVFVGAYRLTVASKAFIEPGDAEQLVTAALAHLK